jgi:7-carboxy-7-deazaguanine synthase
MAVAAVIKQVEGLGRSLGVSRGLRLPLVELTGGEPLLQKNSFDLMTLLADKGYTVLVETSGAHDISGIDPRIRRIMDLKCPSSGEMGRNRLENLEYLSDSDEVKFVIASREDYQWARNFVREHKLDQRCEVLFSWVNPLTEEQRDSQLKGVPVGQTLISRQMLVDWIIEDQLPVRFQLQLHKHIWNPDQKGV